MKKTIALLLLMSMMLALCAACGGSKEEASAPAVSEAANSTAEEDLPTVQRNTNAADDQDDTGMIAAEENTAAGANVDTDWLGSLSEEQRYVEENLIGASVEDLLDYLGEPNATEYTTTCLGHGGEDGILWYDDFIVSTTRYPNGSEVVLGTEEN